MNLWHDKSYISPSGPEWVERGYAMYDVHSVRFQFVYTEEQKKANRRAHSIPNGLHRCNSSGSPEGPPHNGIHFGGSWPFPSH